MMAAQITVDVGVQLNVLQSSINELKSILSKLEIDSSSFKKVSSLIDSMSNSMQKFQTQTSKAFTSQGQFDKAQGTLEKIEETLNRTQQAIKNIKFSDLKLDNSQLDSFKQLVSNLDEAKTVYNNFLSSLKSQATAGFDLKNLGINASDMKGSLEEVQDAIARVIENANNKLIGLQNQFDNTKAKVKELTNSLAKDAKTSATGLPTDFNKYINSTGTGFKGGSVKGKQEVIQQLKEQFQLTPTEVQSLVDSNFNQIKDAFQQWAQHPNKLIPDNIFSAAIARLKNQANDFKTSIDDTKTQIGELKQLESNVDVTFNTETAQAKLKELEETVAQLKAQLEEYKNAQVSAATSAPAMTSASDSIKNSLQGLVTQLEQTNVAFTQMQQRVQTLNGIKQAIVNFTGFNSVMNLVKSAVREAASTIKELDSIMNTISIVTNMTTSDLWKQVGVYSEMAQNYGVSIKGAYEVSKIYYQQGLQTNDVLNLTNETLKLCKVSGLDYATSTDYMTTALRGFKMEMSEASTIVDVYSSLASTTAVSQGELAEAMSKTASSLESVGTTFQEASSMIATMVAVTRESATNIGSALKSIAARYGELTKSTDELATDADGQVVSFNKVDKALQTVGITMQTTDGQFRSFTDVITELTGKWDQLSSTQQRYIATQFAGNRQQSRFLALVSNGDMLQQNLNTANTSEGLGTAQALKALDSLESKIQQVKTAYQQFYVSMGAENVWKAALTGITNFTNSLNSLPKLFGIIPVNAIAVITSSANIISNLLLKLVDQLGIKLKEKLPNIMKEAGAATKTEATQQGKETGEEFGEKVKEGIENKVNDIKIKEIPAAAFDNLLSNFQTKADEAKEKVNNFKNAISDIYNIPSNANDYKAQIDTIIDRLQNLGTISEETAAKLKQMSPTEATIALESMGSKAETTANRLTFFSETLTKLKENSQKIGSSITNFGSAINLLANFLNKGDEASKKLSGSLMAVAGVAMTAGAIIKSIGNTIPWMAIATGILTIVNGVSTFIETTEERITRLKKEAEDLSNTAKQVKADEKTLQTGYDKLKQLETARYESAEAAKEYQTQVDNLANSFPELVSGFDSAGNAIINIKTMEEALANARKNTAQATYEALEAERKAKTEEANKAKSNVEKAIDPLGTTNVGGGKEIFTGTSVENTAYPNIEIVSEEQENANEILTNALNNYKNIFQELGKNFSNINTENFATILKDIKNLSTEDRTELNDKLGTEYATTIDRFEDYLYNGIITSVIWPLKNADFTTDAGQEAYNNFMKNYQAADKETQEILNNLVGGVEEFSKNVQTIVSTSSSASSYAVQTANVLLSLVYATDNSMVNWLNTYPNIATLLSNKLAEAFDKQKENGYDNMFDFINSSDIQEQINNFYTNIQNLDEETRKWLENLSTSGYTLEQAKAALQAKTGLNNKDFEENYSAVIEAMGSVFESSNEAFKTIQKNFDLVSASLKNANISSEDFDISKINLEALSNEEISQDFASWINSTVNQAADLAKKGLYNEANALATLTNDLIALYTDENTNLLEKIEITNLFKDANVNTIEGLKALREKIENSTLDDETKQAYVDKIDQAINEAQENVILAYEASLSNALSVIEADEKVISKMTSGMNMTEAQTLIAKANSLGLSSDWKIGEQIVQQGDKFIVTADALKEFFVEYKKSLQTNLDDANTAYDNLLRELSGAGITVQDLDASNLASQLYDWYTSNIPEIIELFKKYGIEFKSDDRSKNEAIIQAKLDEIRDAKTDAEIALNSAADAMYQTALWALGEYTDVWSDAEGKFDFGQMSIDLTTPLDNLNATTKAAVTKIQSGLNTLLSDYISKAGKINWSDYTNSGIESHLLNEMREFRGSYEDFINEYATMAGKTVEEVNNLLVQAKALDTKTATKDALKSIITSYDNFTYEVAAKYASAIGVTITDLLANSDKYGITANDIGGYQIDYDKITATLEEMLNVGDIIESEYNEMRAQLEAAKTTATNKVSSVVNEIVKNRTAVTDEQIANLATSINTTYEKAKELLQASQNSDGTYNVDLTTLRALIDLGALKVNEETKNLIANQIDNTISSISDLFSNQSKGTTSFEAMQKAVNEINNTLGTDYDVSALYSYNEELKAYQLNHTGLMAAIASMQTQLQNVNDEQAAIIKNNIDTQLQSFAQNIDISGYINEIGTGSTKVRKQVIEAMADYNDAITQLGYGTTLNIAAITNALRKGGNEAVKAAEAVAQAQGKTLTTEEVSSIYRSAVERLNTTAEQVVSAVGTVVDETAAELINKYGGSATEVGNSGKYLIQEVGNLEAIYADLIEQMSNTAGATAEDIKNLTNKVKSYNDTLISQHREVEKTITDEINNLGSAKGGDWVNITQLWSTLQSQLENQVLNITDAAGAPIQITAFDLLKSKLEEYGATLDDGILKLDSDANIAGAITTLTNYAQEYGNLLQSDVAQLADTLDEVLKSFASSIETALSGSLTKSGAVDLTNMVKSLGLDNVQLDFTETVNGLKLSQQSAAQLVIELKKANNEASQLVFDKVYTSLTSASGEFSTIQKTTAAIYDKEQQIESITAEINTLSNKTAENGSILTTQEQNRLNKLKSQKDALNDQLSLYKQIQSQQAKSADSYNFMGNSSPSYLDGVTNYWNSVGTAFKSMNSAASSGYMSIQDFQNIVNEMNSLAASTGNTLTFMGRTLSGKSSEAAALINEGMAALENVDGSGVQINLSKVGTNVKLGADSMQTGFTDAVKEMAASQVEMLDAAIQMLEVIVQMEALGDIDVDNNNVLNLNEIFDVEYDGTNENGEKLTKFNENYTEWAEQVMEASKTNTDLEAGLKNISINGHTMEEYISAATGTIEEQTEKFKKLNISEEQYAAVMQAFYEAVQNGDYNLENISASVWETFEKIMPDGTTINTGNRTIVISGETHWSIDWTSENTQNLVSYVEKTLKTDEAGAKEAITQAVERTEKGEAQSVTDVAYTLAIKPNTGVVINKNGTITIEGKEYSSNTNEYRKYIREAALKNAGLSSSQIKNLNITGEEEETVSTTIKFGKTEIKAEMDKNANINYQSEGGKSYNSPEEAAKATVLEIIESKYGSRYFNWNSEKQQEIFEKEYYAKYQIAPKIETEVTDASGAGINSSNVASVRASAEKIANASIEEVQGWVDEALKTGGDNGNGTVTITVDNFSKTVSVENAASEFSSAANEIAGQIDTSLIGNIQTAIENAFAADSFTNAISTAMTTGITQAFTTGEEGTSFSVPNLTLTPTSLTVDTTDITPKLDVASETPTIEISTLTLKPTGDITVDMTDKTPKLGDSETQTVDIPTVTLNVTGDVTINTGTNIPTLDKTEFTIPTAIKAIASILNLDLETASSTVINKTIQELPADQKLELAKALVTIISLSLDTTNSTLDPKSKSMEGLPNDQQLEAKEAVALIKKINPDTAEAVFGNLTYTIPEENKTFKVSDIFTALIQTINAQTISGKGGTNITLPKFIDVGDKTIPIAQALAIIQSVSAQLGQGVVPDYSSIVPEGDIEIHKNIVIVADNVSLDASNGGSVDLGTMNDELIAQATQAGVTADKVNTLNEKYAALADAMVNVEKTGGSEESLEGLTSAVTEYGTALDDVKDSVTNFDMTGDVTSSVESAKTAIASTVEALGGSIPEGFATAVEAGKGEIDTAVSTAVQDVPQDINDVVDMNSPSHMAQEYGESIPEGFALGVNNGASEVDTAITTMVSGVPTEISTTINSTNWSGMGSQVSSDLASGLSSNKESVASAAKTLVSAVTDNLDFSNVSTSIGKVDVKSIDEATYDKTLKIEDIKEGKANVKNVTVGANAITASKTLSSLQGLDFSTTSSSLSGVKSNLDKISGASFSNFDTMRDKLVSATTQAETLWGIVQKFANQTFTVNLNQTGGETTKNSTENKTVNETKNVTETRTVNNVSNTTVNVDTSSAQTSAKNLATTLSSTLSPAITTAKTRITLLGTEIGKIPSKATLVSSLASAMGQIPTGKSSLVANLASAMSKIPDGAASKISSVVSALRNVPSGSKSLSVQLRYSVSKAGATGNIGGFAHAKGKGEALAGGRKTLMGELGPELVVSNGRYFLVGQNGAEFVNLAKDAIVFNHKQTKRLMEQGAIGSRGRAFTNENNAVSLAKGKLPFEGMAAAMKEYTDTGGSGGERADTNNTAQKTKTVTETIRSVSISPSQSEPIKLYSFAKGNVNGGPALASASAALAALKEIRAAWKALSEATAKTLGSSAGKSSGSKSGSGSSGSGGSGSGSSGKGSSGSGSGSGSGSSGSGKSSGGSGKSGGSSGGGGGSSSDSSKAAAQVKSVTEDIERWYDLERQIAAIEKEINYQQALRSKYESDRVANGEKIYETYQKELRSLEKQIVDQQELVRLQKSFYDVRREELAKSEFGKIFTYTENGLQQYVDNKPGSGRGLDILENLTKRNENGQLVGYAVNAFKQLEYLNKVGFKTDKLIYNDDGTVLGDYRNIMVDKNGNVTGNKKNMDNTKTQEKRAEIAEKMMENFWNQLEGWQTEMDSLWDTYNETLKTIEENQTKQNEILQKLVDNELSIEQDIYKAVEARKQSDIDRVTEEKEAISAATEQFTSGLSDQLERERSMYDKNQQSNDLTKLQRQLAILERSGGSSSQIRALQDQIDSQLQDNYFNKQQEQIDAIKEASDKQLAQLETQIDIMSESLEYQKEHGLLWAEVRDIMKLSSNEVIAKLLQWNPEFAEKSSLDLNETLRDIDERYQIWDSDRGVNASLKQYQDEVIDNSILSNEDKDIVGQAYSAAYSRAVAQGSSNPDQEAREFASRTMTGLGYHDYESTTGQASANYREALAANQSVDSKYKKNMGNTYESVYDTTYADEFKKAYTDYLTGSGEVEVNGQKYQYQGLASINDASTEQQSVALAFAELQAAKEAESTAESKAAEKNEENKDKQEGLAAIKNKKDGVYQKARTAIGQTLLDNVFTANATNAYNTTYANARKTMSVDEAIAAAQAAFENSITTQRTKNYGKGAINKKPIKAFKIKKKQAKKGKTNVTLSNYSNGKVTATFGSGKNRVSGSVSSSYFNLNDKERIKLAAFKQGGLIDYTGPAIVHGSKSKPESVLTAEQTKFLRQDLLGNSSTSLMSIIAALQETMGNTALSSINNANSVTIENVNLTFESGVISNDYDARRAGANAIDEIMRIARQAGNNSVSRR